MKSISATPPVPQRKAASESKQGFFSKLFSWFAAEEVEEQPKSSKQKNQNKNRSRDGYRGKNRRSNNRSGGNNRRRNNSNNRRRNDNSRKASNNRNSNNRNTGNGKSYAPESQPANLSNKTQAIKSEAADKSANTNANS